jgi:hypothetical protein
MRCTSCGKRGKARETRFCTWICAMSGSVPCLKAMVSTIWPSTAIWELMYSMPSTPLITCSSGAATVSAITSGLAPG